MKATLLLFIIMLGMSILTIGQTDGITYQAVIIDQNAQEIPGVDISGNYLIESDVSLLFTIRNAQNQIEFQEIHQTRTDAYGMVNLVIGSGETTILSEGEFNEIEWNGTPKSLDVGIRFDTGDFDDFSSQELYFVPYAYHRNITATGSLTVDGTSTLNNDLLVNNGSSTHLTGDLLVNGSTNIEGDLTANTLEVLNESTLNGTLVVEGESTFNSNTTINGTLDTNGDLNVNNGASTNLSGDLTVAGSTAFTGPVEFSDIMVSGNSDLQGDVNVGGDAAFNGITDLNGQVTIDADMDANGGQSAYSAYPLRVEGSSQGIAIQVKGGEQESKNFMTFYNGFNSPVGCVEGQTLSELHGSFRYIWDYAFSVAELAFIAAEGVATGSQLDWAESVVMAAGYTAVSAQWIESLIEMENTVGVSFTSGGADYAEWIPKLNPSEKFSPGEVVGIKNGMMSKNTDNADHVLAISTNPIVMGNMPKDGQAHLYGRVGFLGQVPIRVVGKVNMGDYILASGNHDGLAIAVAPDNMQTSQYADMIGVAWENGTNTSISIINTAIGLKPNALSNQVVQLEKELDHLREDVELLKASLLGQRPNPTQNEPAVDQTAQPQEGMINTAMAIAGNSHEISQAEWDAWMTKNASFLTDRMNMVKTTFESQGIDYHQYEEVAFLVDHPIEAINAMRDGTFMPTLWKSLEQHYKATSNKK